MSLFNSFKRKNNNMSNNELVVLTFVQPYAPYRVGESASFDRATADRLVLAKVAEERKPKGKEKDLYAHERRSIDEVSNNMPPTLTEPYDAETFSPESAAETVRDRTFRPSTRSDVADARVARAQKLAEKYSDEEIERLLSGEPSEEVKTPEQVASGVNYPLDQKEASETVGDGKNDQPSDEVKE